jgi:hypothetical protein
MSDHHLNNLQPDAVASTQNNGVDGILSTTVKIKLKEDIAATDDIDMFGNIRLHQLFAKYPPEFDTIDVYIKLHPESTRIKNQFGKIALHYCVDRTQVDMGCLSLLLKVHPLGASEEDDRGITPYDIAQQWRHSKPILKALLSADPLQDWPELIKLRWGPLAPIVRFILDPSRRRHGRANSSRVAIEEREIDGEGGSQGEAGDGASGSADAHDGAGEGTLSGARRSGDVHRSGSTRIRLPSAEGAFSGSLVSNHDSNRENRRGSQQAPEDGVQAFVPVLDTPNQLLSTLTSALSASDSIENSSNSKSYTKRSEDDAIHTLRPDNHAEAIQRGLRRLSTS